MEMSGIIEVTFRVINAAAVFGVLIYCASSL